MSRPRDDPDLNSDHQRSHRHHRRSIPALAASSVKKKRQIIESALACIAAADAVVSSKLQFAPAMSSSGSSSYALATSIDARTSSNSNDNNDGASRHSCSSKNKRIKSNGCGGTAPPPPPQRVKPRGVTFADRPLLAVDVTGHAPYETGRTDAESLALYHHDIWYTVRLYLCCKWHHVSSRLRGWFFFRVVFTAKMSSGIAVLLPKAKHAAQCCARFFRVDAPM